MDWKKLLKNLGLWEQFSYARSSKRKVCSGFSFGVGASLLLLTVFFLNYPFKEPLLYPTFEGFNGIGGESSLASSPLSFSSTDASSSLNFQRNEEERVQEETREGNHSERTKSASFNGGGLVTEKTHQENLSEKGKNNSFLGSNDGELVTEKTHEGNPTERTESASSNGGGLVAEKTQQGILSEKGKNDTFLGSNGGELITEKTYEENPTERTEGASSNGGGLVTEKTHQLNISEKGKNCSFLGSNGGQLITERTESASSNGGGLVTEKTRKGNFSEDINGSFVVGEKTHQGNFSVEINKVKTLEAELVERYRNGSFLGKLRGFTDRSTNRNNMANVSDNGESVRSFDREESISEINHKDKSANSSNSGFVKRLGNYSAKKCDIFNGRWVRDEGKPYYPAGSCPYISKEFDCHRNGRPDNDYEKWRWQPNECDIPSLNATDFLERLRGKRLVFVGDSLSRNMWQSLVCILRHSVANKKKVYEITGKKEFKKSGFYSFRYEDYNCSIDLVTAPFLVRKSSFNGRNGSVETLRLDLMDRTTSMYRDADIIVFNSGHWWTHEKTSKGENYYQEGNYVYPKLKVLEAFKKAITTWARWVDKNINVNRTQVFFRGYSLVHFSGGQWNSGGKCHKETEPIFNETYVGKYPAKMRVLEHMLQQMSTPVVYMNVSKLTDYRKDAHPSIYRQRYDTVEEQIAAVRIQDCSHWCLPGVPDTWNELLYASLLMSGRGSWRT